MPGEPRQVGLKWLLTFASMIVILAGLKVAKPLIVPLIFAAFLALVSSPMVFFLHKRKVPTLVSVPLVVLVVVAVLSIIGGIVGGQVNKFMAEADKYQERLDTLSTGALNWMQQQGMDVSGDNVASLLDTSAVTRFVGTTITGIAGLLSDFLLVALTLIFILFEVTTFPRKMKLAMDDPQADLSRFDKVVTEVKQYIVIKTYTSLATGVTVGLFLWIVGVDFPFLWGLLAFLLNYVPNIGSALAAIPAVLLTLVQLGWGHGLVVLIGYVIVNAVIGNFIEPAAMGRRLGLSTLVVFVSLIFWGWLWGPMGMLLSVPLTMIIKILLENSQYHWVAVILGGDPEKEPPSLPPPSLRKRPSKG